MAKKCYTTKADETPEFVEFWDIWRPHARHTDGRGSARDAFFAHVAAGADPQDIVDGARWFIRTLKDPQFIPLVATWLNRRAFEDMAEQERAHQRRLAERRSSDNVVSMAVTPIDRERRAEMARRARELLKVQEA